MEQQQPGAKSREDFVWEEQDTAAFRVRLSAAYHGRCERFYNMLERCMQAFTAITATAAFSDLFGKAPVLMFLTAVFSILPLVFNLAGNAQRHGQLKAGFKTVLAAMCGSGIDLTEEEVQSFKARITELEAGEPQAMPGVVLQCQNELAIAAKDHENVYPLTWWEKLLMHFVPWDVGRIIERTRRKRAEEAKRREREEEERKAREAKTLAA